MSESPDATRKRNIALARPLSSWTRRSDMEDSPHPDPLPCGEREFETPLPRWGRGQGEGAIRSVARAELLHVVVGGQHLLAGDVLVIDHDADATLDIDLGRAEPGAHGGLA